MFLQDEDSDVLKLLCVYYTVAPSDQNAKISSVISLKAGENTYDSLTRSDVAKYSASYYCASGIKEVYKGESNKQEKASSADESYVKKHINGHYWDFYVNSTSYKIKFFAPNKFELTTSLGTKTGGTYTVKNGYVSVKIPNGAVVDIPWSKGEDDIELDVVAGYDVTQ